MKNFVKRYNKIDTSFIIKHLMFLIKCEIDDLIVILEKSIFFFINFGSPVIIS